MPLVLKLQNKNDIRRVGIEEPLNFSQTVELARKLFDKSDLPKSFRFSYVDPEEDTIIVTSDVELVEAYKIASQNANSVVKLEIKSTDPEDIQNGCCFTKFFCNKKFRNGGACQQWRGRRCGGFGKLLLLPLLGCLLCKPCFLFWLIPLFLVFAAARCFLKKTCERNWNCSKYQCFTSEVQSTSQPKSEEEKAIPEVNNNNNHNMEASSASIANDFAGNLKRLEEMGFDNRARNIELLIKNSGNLLSTVKDLLEKRD